MGITRSESNFYKKNGYLLKEELISKKDINKLNTLINKIVTKEKNSRRKIKNQGGTQSYDNYHFVFNSNSSKNKEILRLNNPQNNNKLFYDLSRNKKIEIKEKESFKYQPIIQVFIAFLQVPISYRASLSVFFLFCEACHTNKTLFFCN